METYPSPSTSVYLWDSDWDCRAEQKVSNQSLSYTNQSLDPKPRGKTLAPPPPGSAAIPTSRQPSCRQVPFCQQNHPSDATSVALWVSDCHCTEHTKR